MRGVCMSAVVVIVAFAGLPVADAASPSRARVAVADDYFDPGRVVVKKRGYVTWRWVGENPHNVALTKPGERKVSKRSRLKESGRFTHRFNIVGRWRAVCEVHPDTMRMRVVVRRS